MSLKNWNPLLCAIFISGSAFAENSVRTEPGSPHSTLMEAIRQGDLAATQMLLSGGADPNATDNAGTPALMNAALYGNARLVKLLLENGANPNAADAAGATALIWAASDPEKARLLVQAGADVNARSKAGRTPLMAASAAAGGAETVKLLLDRGARVDVRDELSSIPVLFTGGGKATPLIEAGRVGDSASIRMLVRAGADINAIDSHRGSALSEAVLYGRRDVVRWLLEQGASVKEKLGTQELPMLTIAAIRGDAEIASQLIAKGAEVNVKDKTGATPLMWAAYADRVHTDLVDVLLKAGAEVNARDQMGETALDWALRRGETSVVRKLRAAGASRGQAPVQTAPMPANGNDADLNSAVQLLAKTGEPSFKKSGCASCHNHLLPLVTMGVAKKTGIEVDQQIIDRQINYIVSMMKPMSQILLEGTDVMPDAPVTAGNILEALAAHRYVPDRLTASLVHNVAMKQAADGRWVGWAPRPPLEYGDIQATALAIRAIRLYPIPGRRTEMETRVKRAGMWLRAAIPVTTEDSVMRLLGLKWAGLDAKEVRDSARRLVAEQRGDGGWGQLAQLPSDAYATAKVVYALRESGDFSSTQKRGLRFLRRNQQADGSWHVVSRAHAFQPLVDGDFPHARDQWISAAATSWATRVLAEARR